LKSKCNNSNVTNIWWIRRDLRLTDNQALLRALEGSHQVIPLFILDPYLLGISPERSSFLFACLRDLDKNLKMRGSRLIIREGSPVEVFSALNTECKFAGIFSQEDYSPYSIKRDNEIIDLFPLKLVSGLTLFPPGAVKKSDGNPYQKFTPFRNAFIAIPRGILSIEIPKNLPPCPNIPSKGIENRDKGSLLSVGETFAHKILQDFVRQDIYKYSYFRDRVDLDKTSHLSPYLKFGLLPINQAFQAALKAADRSQNSEERESCQIWVDELVWREFYYQIMFHHPHVIRGSFHEEMSNFPWNDSDRDYASWKNGETGYPIVDAGMRQLNQLGWMHNRTRMITASFLVKDLLINWQKGEGYFRKKLIDYDPASNNGGWQWVAGSGTDSVPYFRIFNPILQGKRFDPEGEYIKKYIPELANVPNHYIHSPWEMPIDIQEKSHCEIGKDYPNPIIDHNYAKQRTLRAYKMMKRKP